MQQTLSLIADPNAEPFDDTTTEAAADAMSAAGARMVGGVDWLAPGFACEIPFDAPEPAQVGEAVQNVLSPAAIDIVVQPVAGRRKKLLVADMESTIIENELVDDLASFVGVRGEVAAITRRAMNGEIPFRPALDERVALLAGLEVSALRRACHAIRFISGADTLVRTMRSNGAFTALVSGGFRTFTTHVRYTLGFEYDLANDLEIRDGRLTGRLIMPILGRDDKLAALQRLARDRGLTPADALAVGDGANDLPMLQAAGLGVAFHAKPAVASATRVRVNHGDLTALLYLQGYRASEFVT